MRNWYIYKNIENGWSQSVLVHQIESNLFEQSENDNPTIGLILCKEKNKIEAEYALRDINKPIGISEYQITKNLPNNLKSRLPSIEEIEEKFEND